MNTKKVYLAQTASFFWEVVKVVVISLAIIIPIRYFLIQSFYVKGASMEPNYTDYEYLIIDELSYRFNDPVRGEVVVVHDPRDAKQFFIKRVIGIPGDEIDILNGKIVLNGVDLDETAYLDDSVVTDSAPGKRHFKLEDKEYFILGDNRPASYDSRRFGPITYDDLIGRVWIRAWPFDRLAIF
ncbi:MAG: signal peptidase I [bacterium]|nr:signal peptidase I [bacterium]